MVGAASSATPHTPMGWSSHGSRIDCYGWGENINTTGAALIVQGIAQRIGELLFPAKMAEAAKLLVSIPEKMRDNEYDVVVRQTYEGREIGRITWRLTPKVQERPRK
jgi:hypothetical protein